MTESYTYSKYFPQIPIANLSVRTSKSRVFMPSIILPRLTLQMALEKKNPTCQLKSSIKKTHGPMQIMTSLLFHFPLLSDWLAADILWYKSGLDRGSCVAFDFATKEVISEERASDI